MSDFLAWTCPILFKKLLTFPRNLIVSPVHTVHNLVFFDGAILNVPNSFHQVLELGWTFKMTDLLGSITFHDLPDFFYSDLLDPP